MYINITNDLTLNTFKYNYYLSICKSIDACRQTLLIISNEILSLENAMNISSHREV